MMLSRCRQSIGENLLAQQKQMMRQIGPFLSSSQRRMNLSLYFNSVSSRKFASSPSPSRNHHHQKQNNTTSKDQGSMYFVKAGLPMILFCGLGMWVVSNGIEGKNRERDTFQGRISKSERQALMDQEHAEMMEKMSHIISQDNFDNTKRIERPEEVLERRRKEREERNRWYRRWWRAIRGRDKDSK